MSQEQQQEHQHGHHHPHEHQHHHAHGHTHEDGYGHGNHHGDSQRSVFDGETYWKYPGVRETGIKTAATFCWAMNQAGVDSEALSRLNLLEVGCGGGAATPHLAKQVSSLHGIDVDDSMLVSLSRRLPNLDKSLSEKITYSNLSLSPTTAEDLLKDEAQPSPTADNPNNKFKLDRSQWDAAVITNVLHHVADPEGFFVGLGGVIKRGGWIVIIEPKGLFPSSGEVYDVTPLKEGEVLSREELIKMMQHGHDHSNWHTPEAVIDIMKRHGIEDIKQEMHGTMPTQGVGQQESGCLVTWGRFGSSN